MKGSLIIVSFFIIGTLCGVYHLIPYDFTDSKLIYYALCGLMFCVGISIGNDPNTLKSFRSLNPRLVFLPIMTILGTLAGCAIAGAFMSQRSPLDCMAVGAGFGYYSLSSIFITEYKGPELGGSGAAGRHDPDHRGAGDRGGCRQRRLLGRARRRRSMWRASCLSAPSSASPTATTPLRPSASWPPTP